MCGAGGRGLPHISTQAPNFVMVHRTARFAVSGTSCAVLVRLSLLRPPSSMWPTPNVQTAVGIISPLNDHRLSKGQAPLGFPNPWLYGDGVAGLNDITSGSNPGCWILC